MVTVRRYSNCSTPPGGPARSYSNANDFEQTRGRSEVVGLRVQSASPWLGRPQR